VSSLITLLTTESQQNAPQKTKSRIEFDRWANEVREVSAMRQKATGRGGFGGGVNWWARLPENFRVFLLSTITDDDWERYALATWDGLPDGLRSAIATECRALSRIVGGCPWR
jgi:hypothetical protein